MTLLTHSAKLLSSPFCPWGPGDVTRRVCEKFVIRTPHTNLLTRTFTLKSVWNSDSESESESENDS
jgi:hypothetical protein